jgi:hypothetical protein
MLISYTFAPLSSTQNLDTRGDNYPDTGGDNLYLMVYIIKLADRFKYDQFKISEKNFLLPELCKNPIGLALSRDFLSKTGYTRLFIVGRNQ